MRRTLIGQVTTELERSPLHRVFTQITILLGRAIIVINGRKIVRYYIEVGVGNRATLMLCVTKDVAEQKNKIATASIY